MFHSSRSWPYGSFNHPEYSCNSGYISLKQKTRKAKRRKKRSEGPSGIQSLPTGDTLAGSQSPLLTCTLNTPNYLSRSLQKHSKLEGKSKQKTKKK